MSRKKLERCVSFFPNALLIRNHMIYAYIRADSTAQFDFPAIVHILERLAFN